MSGGEETFRQLTPILTDDCQRLLDTLLEPDSAHGMTPLAWLRRPAISNSPKAIVGNLEKLTFLRATGVEAWSLEALNPNRLTFLAQLARKIECPGPPTDPRGAPLSPPGGVPRPLSGHRDR